MVTKWGLSEKLGPLNYDDEETSITGYPGYGNRSSHVSNDTAYIIDAEVKSHHRAQLWQSQEDT